MPMMRGATPAVAVAKHARLRGQFEALDRFGRSEQHGACAIVHARSIARGDRPIGFHEWLQTLDEASKVVSARGCSSLSTVIGTPLRGRIVTGRSPLRALRSPSPRGALLAAIGEGVLIVARDVELFGDVLPGLRHRIHAVLRLHHRIDESPADGGVLDFMPCAKTLLGLAHNERCARHALHAPGNHQRGSRPAYGARRDRRSIEARSRTAD